ncbi:MAG TPA: DNA primase [Thermoanaerobaculia bacterium]|nr:DNA primase [Thermoanaerobaculia bacterium]
MNTDLDINDSVLAQLRSAADIVEVIGDHTRLKKAGRSWKGLCPFHNERTPSFTVDRDKGLYHCFGCGAGGDVIHFVRQIDRLEFPEAVEALAGRFGVSIPRRERRGPREDRREKLLAAVSDAQRFYSERLSRPGNAAARYLEGRGVAPEIWKDFALGHAPDAWDSISKALGGAYPEDLLVEAGLLQPRAEGKGPGSYDRFRDRLLFVVRDERGRPVGFGGRTLSPDGEPKYLNSPESPLFSKKRLLYGLSDAREAIRKRDRVVLVEGYFDHLALWRAGIHETVASMGTALTPEQTEKLRRLTSSAVICYDGDAAGRNATHAALALLLGHGFAARAARMPLGEDPDDVLRREGAEALAARIDEAADALTWLIEDVRPEEPGLEPAEKRARLGRILDVLSAIPDRILRYEEYRRLSEAVAVPLEVLWGSQKEAPRAPRPAPPGAGTEGNRAALSEKPAPPLERRLLQYLAAGRELNSLILGALREEWVTDPRVARIVTAFRKASARPEVVDFQGQIADLTEEDRTFLSGIALDEFSEPTEKGVDQLLKDLETKHLERESLDLTSAIKQGEARGGSEIDELIRMKQEKARRIAKLKSRKGNEVGH